MSAWHAVGGCRAGQVAGICPRSSALEGMSSVLPSPSLSTPLQRCHSGIRSMAARDSEIPRGSPVLSSARIAQAAMGGGPTTNKSARPIPSGASAGGVMLSSCSMRASITRLSCPRRLRRRALCAQSFPRRNSIDRPVRNWTSTSIRAAAATSRTACGAQRPIQ